MRVLTKNNYVSLLILLIFASFIVMGYSTGIAGVTKKNTSNPGCTCHSQNPNASVLVTIGGPSSLAPGATGTYTVTVSGGPLAAAGFNAAASGGTISVNAIDPGVRIINGEATHNTPKPPTSGKSVFTFNYKAPATAGDVTIFANGNSVDLSTDNSGDSWNFATNKTVAISTTGVGNEEQKSISFSLAQNYPNPFNPGTIINYRMSKTGKVLLSVFDLSGREVAVLVNEEKAAGEHIVSFNASALASGIYYYKLESGNISVVKKMILEK